MSEKPINFQEQREFRIKRLKTAIDQQVEALSGGNYEIEWQNEDDFSLRRFSFRLRLVNDEGYATGQGHFSIGASILTIPELEEYQLDETAVEEVPPTVRFVRRDPDEGNQ